MTEPDTPPPRRLRNAGRVARAEDPVSAIGEPDSVPVGGIAIQDGGRSSDRSAPADPPLASAHGSTERNITARIRMPFWSMEYSVSQSLDRQVEEAVAEKRNYAEKLEAASGSDIFKYLLLINTSELDRYVAQTLLQAEQSFISARRVAIAGFVLLAVGIGFGFYSGLTGKTITPAYLAASAGALTQFISGVMFYLYNKTLQQINRFHDKLVTSQHVSISFLASSGLTDPAARDKEVASLAAALIATSSRPEVGTRKGNAKITRRVATSGEKTSG